MSALLQASKNGDIEESLAWDNARSRVEMSRVRFRLECLDWLYSLANNFASRAVVLSVRSIGLQFMVQSFTPLVGPYIIARPVDATGTRSN